VDCPVDATTLQMTERQGIEIDYCPSCRGVWLDRGELDKLIERSQQYEAAPAPQRYAEPERHQPEPRFRDDERRHRDFDDDDDDHWRHGSRHGGKRKRKNMLEDLFDFG
jgi:Zn-finger nucleic acid-binding protein